MCKDTDLFGEVVVTFSDIEFWLDHVANLKGRSNTRRESYFRFYDVSNKIIESKKQGRFTELINQHEQNVQYEETPPTYTMTKYVEESSTQYNKCTGEYHFCNNKNCEVRKKLLRKKRNQRYYQKRKLLNNKIK